MKSKFILAIIAMAFFSSACLMAREIPNSEETKIPEEKMHETYIMSNAIRVSVHQVKDTPANDKLIMLINLDRHEVASEFAKYSKLVYVSFPLGAIGSSWGIISIKNSFLSQKIIKIEIANLDDPQAEKRTLVIDARKVINQLLELSFVDGIEAEKTFKSTIEVDDNFLKVE